MNCKLVTNLSDAMSIQEALANSNYRITFLENDDKVIFGKGTVINEVNFRNALLLFFEKREVNLSVDGIIEKHYFLIKL